MERTGQLKSVQPLHLLVSIFMKTRSMVGPPYADLDEKVLMHSNQRMAELTLKIIITGYGIGSVNMLY